VTIDDPTRRGILVVDDELGARESLRYILRAGRFSSVHFASDGQQALDVVSALGSEIYLILLDMRMPVMDGMTFLDHLAKRGEGSPIGVIAVTGVPSESGKDAFFKAAAPPVHPLKYLAKPYEVKDILVAVGACMDTIHGLRRASPN
jgi:CheY-like chemotaxis protein